MSAAANVLNTGLAAMGLEVGPEAQARLLAYAALMLKWNRIYNLTAVRDEISIVQLHLLDSLAVLPFLKGKSLADIGSGGGLPGIPLAIVRPDLAVTLVESNQKKSAFQRQAAIELGLSNLRPVCMRVEQLEGSYDIVTSRAFSDLADFVSLSSHLLAPGGVLAAMKGVYPAEEIARLPSGFHVEQSIPLDVPGVEGQRHLILITEAPR